MAGAILDMLDLLTFGPIGLWLGMAIGGLAGWWLAPTLGFRAERRWLCALLAGVYCTLPVTSFIPAATLLTIVAPLFRRDDDDTPDEEPGGQVIEVDFRVHKDDDKAHGEDRDGPPR